MISTRMGATFGLLAALLLAQAADAAGGAKTLRFGVFPDDCFERLVEDLDVGNIECVKKTVSEVLGYAIITGAFIVKVPQILNIVRSGSTAGLAPSSFYLETVAFTSTVVYSVAQGHDFNSFGEALVVLMQDIILVFLLWAYAERAPSAAGKLTLVAGYGGIVAGMYALPPNLRPLLPSISTASTIASRVPQIVTNFRQGHTGQAAVVTWVLQGGGALARVFTTMTKTRDAWQLFGFSISAALSVTIVLQIIAYAANTRKVVAAAAKKKDDDAKPAAAAKAASPAKAQARPTRPTSGTRRRRAD